MKPGINPLKNSLFKVLQLTKRGVEDSACIYMYHSVGNNGALFTVAPEEFERQLSYLLKKNYQVLKLSELIERIQIGKSLRKTVCITFDDGYLDNYEIAFPILGKYSVPISVFLTTGLVGRSMTNSEGIELPLLSESQVGEMHESGLVEFLPHGAHHKKMHVLSKDEARQEITASYADLEKLLGNIPRIFAFPSGRYTDETIGILKEEQFAAAVTVQPGLVRHGANLYELPRNHVDAKTSFAEFVARLSTAGEWYEKMKKVKTKKS